MNDEKPEPPRPRKDIAPEVPPEVQNVGERSLWTPKEDDGTGGDTNLAARMLVHQVKSKASTAAVRKKIEAVCQAKKISTDERGMPIPGNTKAAIARKIMAENYKDAPQMDGTLGDRTPAFVEWLFLTHPAKAAVRYQGRGTHLDR